MYGKDAEGFDTKHARPILETLHALTHFSPPSSKPASNFYCERPIKLLCQGTVCINLLTQCTELSQLHCDTFLQPFFSVSLLPETRILEVSRCLKAFCGLWQQQLMEICWVGGLKCCSCLRGARPQLWVSLLGRWSNGGRALIDSLPPALDYSLSSFTPYATRSCNTFSVILAFAFWNTQSCPAYKPKLLPHKWVKHVRRYLPLHCRLETE